jgi:hypothetical protein
MHEADVVFNLILIAHFNPAIAQQPAVQAFNLPSPLVSPQRPTVLRFRSGAIATMWSDHLDATLSQCSIQRVRVCRQSDVWVHPPQNNRGLNKFGFVRRSTRYVNGDRKARNCHDLAPFAALTIAAPPFCCYECAINPDKSILPCIYKFSAKTFRIWINTPDFTQAWKYKSSWTGIDLTYQQPVRVRCRSSHCAGCRVADLCHQHGVVGWG